MLKVHRPTTTATTPMCTSRNARLTPTAIASMLVAKPVVAKPSKPCRFGVSEAASSASSGPLRRPATIMWVPNAPSSTKAIQ